MIDIKEELYTSEKYLMNAGEQYECKDSQSECIFNLELSLSEITAKFCKFLQISL